MDGHASLYISDDEAGGQSTGRRIAGWNGLPLTFKVLVSQNAHAVQTGVPGRVAIRGDFQAGRARLFEFLDALATRQLFDPKQLADQVAALVSLLYGVAPPPRYVTLEVDATPSAAVPDAAPVAAPDAVPDDLSGASDAETVRPDFTPDVEFLARPAGASEIPDFIAPDGNDSSVQALLDEVSDLNGMIARAMTQFYDLNAAGQTDEMWRLLGVKARQSDVARPASVGSHTSGFQTPQRPAPPRIVSQPTALKVVCIINIVGCSLAILGGIILLAAAGSVGSGLAGLLALFTIANAIAIIVVVFHMMNGSKTARKIYVALTIIGIPFVIYNMTQGKALQSVFNIIVTIVYLAILFSDESNAYFEYMSGPSSSQRR